MCGLHLVFGDLIFQPDLRNLGHFALLAEQLKPCLQTFQHFSQEKKFFIYIWVKIFFCFLKTMCSHVRLMQMIFYFVNMEKWPNLMLSLSLDVCISGHYLAKKLSFVLS